MNVPVTVNGVTIEIPIDDKVIQETLKKKKKTGYERVNEGERYYTTSSLGCDSPVSCEEYGCGTDRKRYAEVNYYSDINVAENNVRADTLMRQLRRFAAEHGGAVAPFVEEKGYCLIWNEVAGRASYFDVTYPLAGAVRFKNADAAKEAIKIFKDELEWYFRNYAPMPNDWYN